MARVVDREANRGIDLGDCFFSRFHNEESAQCKARLMPIYLKVLVSLSQRLFPHRYKNSKER